MKKLLSLLIAAAVALTAFPISAAAEADPVLGFEISSKAVYMVNDDTGIVVYEKNADEKMYPASLTKVMTAIIAIENCSDLTGSIATAPTYVFDELYLLGASNADIRHGEQMRMIDLLYAMMLRSACEAAGIIADYVTNGDPAKFVQMMNDKAKELGCTNTNFVNVHGLHDNDQYTTAKDMYLIFSYAMKNETFAEIASTWSYELPATNKHSSSRTITHTNSMMNSTNSSYYQYLTASKTGTTDESGRCLASSATKGAYTYTLVTMNAPIYYDNGDYISDNLSYVDAKSLYEWAFNKWAMTTIVKTSSVVGQVKVGLVKDKDVVSVFPEREVEYLLRTDIDVDSSVQKILTLEEQVDAPIQTGDVLGTMEIRYEDKLIDTVNLVAGEDLERDQWLYILRCIKNVFSSLAFKIVVILLILAIAAYIFYAAMYNRKKRRRRRRRF